MTERPTAALMSAIAYGGRAVNPAIAELVALPRWVCWIYQTRADGRITKRPVTPAGSSASSVAPRTWSSFDECWTAHVVQGRHDGLGFVLAGDGLVALDLDQCCALDGATAPWANEVLSLVPSYAERSPSGAGLHVVVRGHFAPGNRKSYVNVAGARHKLEVSVTRFFITVTGAHLAGTPATINRVDLSALAVRFKDRPRSGIAAIPFDGAPPLAAAEVARLARLCPQLQRILQRSYASQSEQDLALCRFGKLAGWPPEKAWSLVAAVRRDGKAERPDYAAQTLARVY